MSLAMLQRILVPLAVLLSTWIAAPRAEAQIPPPIPDKIIICSDLYGCRGDIAAPNITKCLVGDTCNKKQDCECMEIMGAAPEMAEGVGEFLRCYCGKDPGGCAAAYEMHATLAEESADPVRLVFDVVGSPQAFVHMFEWDDVLSNGMLARSMVLTGASHSFSGQVVFEEAQDADREGEDGAVLLTMTSVDFFAAEFELFGYPTGGNLVLPFPGRPNLVRYDPAARTIDYVTTLDFAFYNFLYPNGMEMSIDLRMYEEGSIWRAHGRGATAFPLRMSHDYDAADGTVTFRVRLARPNATVELHLGSACLGDVDRNRVVDPNDLQLVLDSFGRYSFPGEVPADVNFDAVVDDLDAQLVEQNMGCGDGGPTYLPDCPYPIDMPAPMTVTLPTDAAGEAVLEVPVGGLPLSAFYAQANDSSECGKISNLVRLTIH